MKPSKVGAKHLLILLIVLSTPLLAQLPIQYIPEPPELTRQLAGRDLGIILWTIRVWNAPGRETITVPLTRVLMACPDLGFISQARARLHLDRAQKRKPIVIVLDIGKGGATGVTGGIAGGLIPASNGWGAAAAGAAMALDYVTGVIEGKDVKFDQREMLPETLVVPPGQAVEGVVFSRPLPEESLKSRELVLELGGGTRQPLSAPAAGVVVGTPTK